MKRVVLLLIALAVSIGAQVRFEAPTLGYILDTEAKAIRQIGGVAGASAFESTVDAGGSVERAWISRLGFAVVEGKQSDGNARLIDWARGSSQSLGLVVQAAVSNSGRYVAIDRGGSVEVWDGQSGSRTARIEQTAADARSLAVSDDGALVLIASASGLWLATTDRQAAARQVWSGESILGVGFLGETRDYAALDAARNKLLISRGGSTLESGAPLAGATAFATSGNSRLVLGGSSSIVIYDADNGVSRTIASDAAIASFARGGLNAGDVLHIRFRDDQRTALLEAAGDAAQIEFVVTGGGSRQ